MRVRTMVLAGMAGAAIAYVSDPRQGRARRDRLFATIRTLTPGHPVFRTFFEVTRVPQIPSIAHWRRSGGGTSERGAESAVPQMYAISDSHNRIMVLMTHNTDISDAWEREGEDARFFYQFSPDGYSVGINVLMYTMTH